MASELAELFTVLTLESKPFVKGVLDAQASAEASSSKIGQAWAKLAQVGKASAAIVVAGAAASVKLAMDFNQQMALVHTQAGASLDEVSQLSSKVLDLAGQVGIGPTKLAEGLYHVESAGFRGAQAMDILAAAAKTATIGQSDLETTTQALIGVMASQIGGVKDAADAGAILNATVGIGDMRMEKLAQAIATGVLPSFRTAGLSMTDFSASLATLTDNVTPADEAATRLRMTVALMSAPSNKAAGALESIGLKSTSLANDMKKPNGLLVAVMDLKTHLAKTFGPQAADDVNHYVEILHSKGVDAANKWADSSSRAAATLEEAFGGGRTSGAILTLLGESVRLADKYMALGTSSSRAAQFQDAWATQQKLFSQQLKDVGAAAESVGVKIGNFILPYLQKGLGWLSQHTAALKIFAGVIGGIMVAAMIAWTGAVIANTAALLANPMTWIFLAIVAAIAGLIVGIYELVKHWSTVWSWIKRIAGDVWGWILDAWHTVWDKGILAAAKTVWGALVTAWNATWDTIAGVVGWVNDYIIQPIVMFFEDFLLPAIEDVLGVFADIWQVTWTVISTVVLVAYGALSEVFQDLVRVISDVLRPVIHVLQVVWAATWKSITAIASWAWNTVIKPVIGYFVAGWQLAWQGITDVASWAWNSVIKPVAGFIAKYGIDPIIKVAQKLQSVWDTVWGAVKKVVADAWAAMSVVLGYIKTYGIDPVKTAASDLKTTWGKVWDWIKSKVETVWGIIKPIFDKIKNALHDITAGLGAITSDPVGWGKTIAKLLGYDEGGWVPGPDGEFVVSRDMLAGRAATPIRAVSGAAGNTQPTVIVVQAGDTYLDGKKMTAVQQTRAQQVGKRNGQTFYSVVAAR